MEKDLIFKIEGDELKKLREWQEQIKSIHGRYGTFTYSFSCGSGIGIVIKVKSELSKTEIDITDYEKW